MLQRMILIYVFHNPGCKKNEIINSLSFQKQNCVTTMSYLEKKGACVSDGAKRDKRYWCENPEATLEEMDKYVHIILYGLAKKDKEQLCKATGLTSYRVSLSMRRLKNLGKIKTLTGQGIVFCDEPEMKNKRAWTNHEVKYLRENAGKLSINEIATHLERTTRAVNAQAMRNGISTVRRICRKGHNMTLRETGKWVCNECHCEGERVKRNVGRIT